MGIENNRAGYSLRSKSSFNTRNQLLLQQYKGSYRFVLRGEEESPGNTEHRTLRNQGYFGGNIGITDSTAENKPPRLVGVRVKW